MGFLLLIVCSLLIHYSLSQSSASYDDTYGRAVFSRLIQQMSATPDNCLAATWPDWKTFRQVNAAGALLYGNSQVHIAVNEAEKKIQIGFRGSKSYDFFFQKSASALLTDSKLQTWESTKALGKVASGHNETWNYLWPGGLKTAVHDLWAQYCDFKMTVTGHSMGACQAQIFIIQMNNLGLWTPDNMEYYGYGPSRCGDIDFMVNLHSSVNERYRINTGSDITVQNPSPSSSIFVSCPSSATYTTTPSGKECYRHCCYPVKYVSNALTQRCSHEEDSNCGGGASFSDGFTVFGTATSEYGEAKSC